jgi:hypothetical protein
MFRAKLKDLNFNRFGNSILAIETQTDLRALFDRLNEKEIEVEIKEAKKKRSKDANAYMWTLLGELSEVLNIDKITLYRQYVRNIGGNYQVVCVQNQAVNDLCRGWEHNGIGWLTDTAESKLEGCTNVLLYFGSSTYNTKQMSRLLDLVIEDCKENGIEVLTPDELALIKEEWK